jgi:hypothetical protein
MSSRALAVAAPRDGKSEGTHDLAAPHLGLYQWIGGPPACCLNERLQLLGDVRHRIADCIRHRVHGREDSLRGVGLLAHMLTISAHLGAC